MAGLFLAAVPFAVIYLLVSNSGLKGRLKALEKAILESGARSIIPDTKATAIQTSQKSLTKTAPETSNLAGLSPGKLAATQSSGTPKAVIFNTEKLRPFVTWPTQNWFYVVSAISPALAGVFLVIYGVEQGLLPLGIRILLSLAFGGALVGAGEFIRRRFGDDIETHTAYLPSVFSGAGIVTLFGSVLSARLL